MEVYKYIIIIAIFAIGLAGYFYLIPFIKSKTTKAQREEIIANAVTFVKAAEQLIKGTKRGVERYEQVMKWFEEAGFNLKDPKIQTLAKTAIEKTVYEFIND